jgi:outer membrane biosynthesis protein TonB
MMERENILPLLVGAMVALLVHALALSATTWRWPHPGADAEAMPAELDELLAQPRVELGRDGPRIATVAWIAHDDFRRLMAPSSATEQPAVQQDVDPVDAAAMPVDPTPPSPVAPPDTPQPATPPLAEAAQPPQPDMPLDLPMHDAPDGVAAAAAQASPTPPDRMRQPRPEPQPAARPTAAPREQREVAPTQIRPRTDRVSPGSVIVADGIEIHTAHPRFALATTLTAVPGNTRVRVVFNTAGEVIEAQLLASTGYLDVDGPILQSLYRWRARGRRLEELDGPFELRINYLMGRDPAEGAQSDDTDEAQAADETDDAASP